MHVVLVITDATGKNLVFTTDALKTYRLPSAVQQVKTGNLQSIHIVGTGPGTYLRSNPTQIADDNLDMLSVSPFQLFSISNHSDLLKSLPGLKRYYGYYRKFLNKLKESADAFIVIDGIPRTTKGRMQSKLLSCRTYILTAAENFSIDPNVLGAIIIDEAARMAPFEDVIESILPDELSKNASVGIAQVKLETARGLIKLGYYNPNPRDKHLSRENISAISRSYLYAYVVRSEYNVHFAAARIKEVIDQWMPVIDISDDPEIIGTLYSQPPRKPNKNPKPDPRGLQIKEEFYPLAKSILAP